MRDLIRVLVVDDSALMRKLIPQALQRDPGIEVIATAMDGNFALKKIREFHPAWSLSIWICPRWMAWRLCARSCTARTTRSRYCRQFPQLREHRQRAEGPFAGRSGFRR
jgi:PleD family two-component response regulator